MRRIVAASIALSAGVVALGLWPYGRVHPAHAQETRVPVLVELFTSEGCSDCPPADRVLADLARTQSVPGAYVVALGEHVDYWNNGAWSDRFSSPQFDSRQSDYVQRFHLDSSYTPEMVVDGRREFVGSDAGAAADAIGFAASRPHAAVDVSVAAFDGNNLRLRVSVSALPHKNADVYAAVTEDALTSHVSGGENGGRTLQHAAVVRRIVKVGTVTVSDSVRDFGTVVMAINSDWQRPHLHAVVFVQDVATKVILGTGITPLQ